MSATKQFKDNSIKSSTLETTQIEDNSRRFVKLRRELKKEFRVVTSVKLDLILKNRKNGHGSFDLNVYTEKVMTGSDLDINGKSESTNRI